MNLNGFRQPKKGLWQLEFAQFQSPIPEPPRLAVPWKGLGTLALFVVLGYLLPWDWAALHLLPLLGLTALPWTQYTEAVVGLNHPTLSDTDNRALRTLITRSGQDPDTGFSGFVGPVINVMAYAAGATITDGVTDAAPAIQAAIDAALLSGLPVYLPKGEYKITVPLKIFTFAGGVFTSYVRLTMYGGTLGDTTVSTTTRLVPTFNDVPAIMVQNVRAVRLVDIVLLGKNDFSASVTISNNFSYLMTNSNYVINSCRDSRYSPYAGIAIDPFGTSVPADGGYPGYASYYVASASGASHLEFERVTARGFVAGVIIGPNGTITQGSEIVFKNCWLEYNKVGLAICQNQSRNVVWYGGSNAFNLYCFDGNTYGARTGYAPHIYGCNMAGKYLFNVTSNNNDNHITGIHAEAFASIGFLSQTNNTTALPISFEGCQFNFFDFGGIFPDHHLVTYAPVDFRGCVISTDAMATSKAPLRFFHDSRGPITFHASYVGATINSFNEMFLAPSDGSGGFGAIANDVYFEGSVCGDGGGRGNSSGTNPLSHTITTSTANIDRGVVPSGARIKYTTDLGEQRIVGNAPDTVSLGSLAITLGANGTATFTASDPAVIHTGDLIYSYSSINYEKWDGTITFAPAPSCLGIVSNVSGTTITITGVPQNLTAASYVLYVQWWNRFHQDSVGDLASNTTVSNVTNPSTWAIGNRIKGTGIPAGTYLTNVSGATLTLSKAATATATKVRLYDADTYIVRGEAVPGISADNGDAAVTLIATQQNPTQLWNTTLTAARAVTLSTANASKGSKFRIIRGAGATGAFNLNVGTGPLKALAAASTWCDVEFDGTAWQLTASGAL